MPSLLLPILAALQAPLGVVPLRAPGGPEVLVHGQAAPLVALRLSAPVPPDLPEGAIELLLELARLEVADRARDLGAELSLRHDGGHAVVAVTGPAAAFDALVAVLRRATGEVPLTVDRLVRARARAADRVLARLERPAPRIRSMLWHRLYGGTEPAGPAGATLGHESIRAARGRVFDPARMRVVLVGSVPDPVVRSAFASWGGALGLPAAAAAADTVPAGDAAVTQAHHEWGAIGYPLDADPAVLAVTAELVHRRVAASSLRYGAAEAWHGPGGAALVVAGAVLPADSLVRLHARLGDPLRVRDEANGGTPSEVGPYLRRMIAEAAALTGAPAVADAAVRLRRRLLLEARTAAGKAEVIGRLADAAGRPDAAVDLLEALARVTLEDVRGTLRAALEAPAVLVEVRP